MLKKLLVLLFFVTISFNSIASPHYTIFYGGDIITMEGTATEYVEAVVAEEDKIVYIGSVEHAFKHYPNSSTKFNLKGRTLLPGFIDPHAHPASIGAFILSHDIIAAHDWKLPHKTYPGVSGHGNYLQAIKTLINEKKDPSQSVVIWGYNKLWHGDLSLKELDEATQQTPTIILHHSTHEIFVNSTAMKQYAIDSNKIKAKKHADTTNNHFWGKAFLELKKDKLDSVFSDPKALKLGMDRVSNMLLQNGITAITELGFPSENLEREYSTLKYATEKSPYYSVYLIPGMSEEVALKMRVHQYFKRINTYAEKYNTQNITFLPNQFHIVVDGSIYDLSLQMQEDFLNCADCKSEWTIPLKNSEILFNYYWNKNYKIHVDINGDLGVKKYNAIVKRALEKNPREDHKTTYHNLGYFTSYEAQNMATLDIKASVNPNYLWALSDKYNEVGFGAKRADNMVASRQLTKRGIPVSLHSEFPLAPANPLHLAWVAANRIVASGKIKRPVESLSMFNTIKGITLTAARILDLENELGSIKEGKQATFTILKQNPFKIDPFNIKDIPVAGVVYKGKVKLN